MINKALEDFNSVSRVNMTCIAGRLYAARAEFLREDAAYQEALWRIESDTLLTEEPVEAKS